MTKAKKITTIISTCFFALISLIAFFWYFGGDYRDFYKIAEQQFKIEGLDEGFVPQGLCYSKDYNIFLTSGYMADGSASRIYLTNAYTNKTERYFTITYNEELYNGHAGGIATDGNSVWVAGDGVVLHFPMFEVFNIENAETLNAYGKFETGNGADFVTVYGKNLWVGEFHKEGKYDTKTSHHYTTSDGKTNKALAFRYSINSYTETGVESTTPDLAISMPDLVQGMEILGNNVILSTSYSLADSKILFYQGVLWTIPTETFKYNDTEIGVYILEDSMLSKTITTPCMSEEIVIKNEKLYILYESYCQKYRAFTKNPLRHVYSIQL